MTILITMDLIIILIYDGLIIMIDIIWSSLLLSNDYYQMIIIKWLLSNDYYQMTIINIIYILNIRYHYQMTIIINDDYITISIIRIITALI